MFIEPLICTQCGRMGRPGEKGFQISTSGGKLTIQCSCGHSFAVEDPRDQQILSHNEFVRLSAASNHVERGTFEIVPGTAISISFRRSFDFPCRAYFTVQQQADVVIKELSLGGSNVGVLSSTLVGQFHVGEPVKVGWLVFGLIDVDNLPPWYLHFYGAMTQLANGFYKPALLDYAVAFESFVETFIGYLLTKKYDADIAEYLLKQTWRVNDRCNSLLQLACGHRMSERYDIYQPWDRAVRNPRNGLAHGDHMNIGREAAEEAHAAVYQAIRWIETVSGERAI